MTQKKKSVLVHMLGRSRARRDLSRAVTKFYVTSSDPQVDKVLIEGAESDLTIEALKSAVEGSRRFKPSNSRNAPRSVVKRLAT